MRDPSATGQSGIAGDEHPRRRSPAFDTSRKSMACISSSKNSGGRPLLYVQVTPLFLAATIAIATAVAFIVGLTVSHDLSMMRQPPTSIGIEDAVVIHAPGSIELPVPVMIEGKKAPLSTYSSKTLLGKTSTVRLDTTGSSSIVVENKTTGADLHLPSGQHLLVDLKGVDSEFLNSEQHLAKAMLDLVTESRLTLLSYHCHSLVPTGVACIGVLLESHVAFRTWPIHGVISLDLFTCGSESLIAILPVIERLFAIPVRNLTSDSPTLTMEWSHKLRGFRKGFSPNYNVHANPLETDLGDFLGRHSGFSPRKPLVLSETAYQRVDIYNRTKSQDAHSLAARVPDKILFLDGVEQSSLRGEAAYHEALVHPAMIAHPNPERVAIIGGGEGATLREVLKYNTVKQVIQVEIDEQLVQACREALSEWSDCSDISGCDAYSCFDDSRATVVFKDAFKWFGDRFEDKKQIKDKQFDVVIMDALDPDKFVAIVGDLYQNNSFVQSIYNGLAPDGVLVIQVGEADSLRNPATEVGQASDKDHLMRALQEVGFASMHVYDESHSHFDAPWAYLVCFKSYLSRSLWYRTAPDIQIELRKRMHRSRSGKTLLKHFDGPTMLTYQMPSKAVETVYCRRDDSPWECVEYSGFDSEMMDINKSSLEVKKSLQGEYAGRGLFAATDIRAFSHLPLEDAVRAFHVGPLTWKVAEGLFDWIQEQDGVAGELGNELAAFYTFVEGYGYRASLLGNKHFTIDAGTGTFCNHGCNGTYNYGDDESTVTELNADINFAPEDVQNKAVPFSPVYERHLRQILALGDYFLRDIKQGEEILCNYLSFVGESADWKEEVENLRSECAGDIMGTVQAYERNHLLQSPDFPSTLELAPLNTTSDCT